MVMSVKELKQKVAAAATGGIGTPSAKEMLP